MQISREEAKARLTATSNLAQLAVEHRDMPHRGSGARGNGLPEFLRDTIGAIAAQPDVKQTDVAVAFNVSDSEVSFCKTGRIGGKPPTAERKEKVDTRLSQIKDTALLKLMQSLNLIDEDKLSDCSAKELSTVAVNLGRVIKDVTPQESQANQVNVIIYSPEPKDQGKYKVIDV